MKSSNAHNSSALDNSVELRSSGEFVRFIEALPGEHIHLWSETKLRVLRTTTLFKESPKRITATTVADGLRDLAGFLEFSRPVIQGGKRVGQQGRRIRLISEHERLMLVFRLLRTNAAHFELLLDSVQSSLQAPSQVAGLQAARGLFPENLRSIVQLLDLLRLNQTTEEMLAATIDEFGNTRREKRRNEEILLILVQYQEALRELSTGKQLVLDRVGLLEQIVNSISRGKGEGASSAFDEIVLDQPTTLVPLEQSALRAISQIIPLTIVCDGRVKATICSSNAPLPPSFVALQSIGDFLRSLKDSVRIAVLHGIETDGLGRSELISAVLDLEPIDTASPNIKKSLQGLQIWPCTDRREEVRRVTRTIAAALETGRLEPSAVQILSFNLDLYSELLVQEAAALGIPLSLPKGRKLLTTVPAGALLALLNWIREPTLSNAQNLWGGSSARQPAPNDSEIEQFLTVYELQISRICMEADLSPKQLIAAALTEFWSIDRLISFAEWAGVSLEDPVGIETLLLQAFERRVAGLSRRITTDSSAATRAKMKEVRQAFPGFIGALARLRGAQSAAALLREESDPHRFMCGVKRAFFASQLSLRELRCRDHFESLQNSRTGLIEYVQARRALIRLINEIDRVLASVSEQAPELLTSGVSNAAFELLGQRISSGYLVQEVRADTVVASEFLDVRAIQSNAVFLLGATADEFPVRKRQSEGEGELQERALRLLEASGRRDAAVESFSLFAYLLSAVSEVVISYPREATGADLEPSAVVSDLRQLLQTQQDGSLTALLQELADVRLVAKDDHVDAIRAAESMLRERSSSEFSLFDGEIGGDVLDNAASSLPRPIQSTGENLYSVSELELLVDCRHRFFFRRVLNLQEADRSFGELLMAEVGKVVHAALERFFTASALEDLNSATGFAEAAERMRGLAEQCLLESEIDWAGSPFAQVLRERIVAGLASRSSELTTRQKKGYLFAALEYQRDRICSVPIEVEYRFGPSAAKGPPLTLSSENGVSQLRGVIDRIDGEIDAEGKILSLFIWDYKTGKPETVSQVEEGKSLQLPLYAAAIANDPRFGTLPGHGACVDLHNPNRSDEEMNSLSKGVILEYLAVSKQGNRYVIDESAVERKVEKALEISRALDKAVRAGSFHQQSETKACYFCEYSQICGRDEVLVALKESADGVVQLREAKSEASKKTTSSSAAPYGVGTKAEIRISAEQELASDITTDIALIAGAGSGKTTVLWNRIVRLVLDGTSISSIVAITYTTKAAGEIQLRLERAIATILRSGRYAGKDLSAVDRTRLLQARSNLPHALIGTIHSFALRILGMDELLAAGLSGAHPLSQSEQVTLQERAIEEILSNRNRSASPAQQQFFQLLDAGFHPRSVREILRRLLGQPRMIPELSRSLPAAESREGGLRPTVREALLERLRSTLSVEEGDDLKREAIGLDLAAAIAALASAVLERYTEVKRQQHAADFEDLIVGAHRMLCAQFSGALHERQSALKARLRRKYRHIMVDEFQDTDPLQWEIVQAILGSGPNDARLGRESCFVVGDAQQAIYGFRGGDIRTLNRAVDTLSKTGRMLALRDNYRSDPEILRFVNGFFGQLFRSEFDQQGQPRIETATPSMPMRPIRAAASDHGPRVRLCITRHQKHRGRRMTKVAEAENVTRIIARVLSGTQTSHSAGPQIAVLTRGAADLSLVAEALRAADLPFSISHNQGFFDLEEIISIENLLCAIAAPEDQISLVGVLRSPLFGLSDRELVLLLARLRGGWVNIWNPLERKSGGGVHSERLERVITGLQELKLLSSIAPASTVVARAVEAAGLETAYRSVNQLERFRNIERFIDSLSEAELRGEIPGGVRSAAQWFDRQRAERSAAPNANNAEHPVVLMTIHGAKGLEFPTVILPFLKRPSARAQETRIGEIMLGKDSEHRVALLSLRVEDEADDFRRGATQIEKLLTERLDALEACEERRVFYVACTRARDQLIFSMTESSQLKTDLRKLAKLTAEERMEQIFRSVTPSEWILRLMQPDSLDEPSALVLSDSAIEGEEFTLPIEFDR